MRAPRAGASTSSALVLVLNSSVNAMGALFSASLREDVQHTTTDFENGTAVLPDDKSPLMRQLQVEDVNNSTLLLVLDLKEGQASSLQSVFAEVRRALRLTSFDTEYGKLGKTLVPSRAPHRQGTNLEAAIGSSRHKEKLSCN